MWSIVAGPYAGAPTNYWRGGYFDYGGFDAKRMTELSRLVDQSQALDSLYNPAQMVDLSQGYDLSDGFDPSRVPSDAPPRAILPGPGLVGLYGMFEDDYRPAWVPSNATAWDETGWWSRDRIVPFVGGRVARWSDPRPRGLLLLGRKALKKKEWRPRRLGCFR